MKGNILLPNDNLFGINIYFWIEFCLLLREYYFFFFLYSFLFSGFLN